MCKIGIVSFHRHRPVDLMEVIISERRKMIVFAKNAFILRDNLLQLIVKSSSERFLEW
jgi:hypothetical protein